MKPSAIMTEINHGQTSINVLVFQKRNAYNLYSRDKNKTDLFSKIQYCQAQLKTKIKESKQKYYSGLSD